MIDVQLIGADTLTKGIAAGQKAIPTEVEQTMERSLLLIEADARRAVRQDTRALMNSITHDVRVQGSTTLTGRVGPSLRYGLFVERGTRPHWPPRAPLEGWARRHNIPVFLVQRAIARHGTKARPFLLPAFEKHRQAIIGLFAKVGATVVQVMAHGGRG